MPFVPVHVQREHIAALVASKRPLNALAELMWNGLDADADEISVNLDPNGLGGISTIRVRDNGDGIAFAQVEALFGNLGGSWKKGSSYTPRTRRGLHGQSGKGRFKAFALGSYVEWKTTSERDGVLVDFTITGDLSRLENFEVSNPVPSVLKKRGTEVVISNLQRDFVSLYNDQSAAEVTKLFAVYLTEYPYIELQYAGQRLNPQSVQKASNDYLLDDVDEVVEGKTYKASLTIIEWNVPAERTLYLCDARGVALNELPAGIQARGYQFTAYLKSDLVRKFNEDKLLDVGELNPGLHGLTTAAKLKMKEHFRKRAAEDANSLVREWKQEQIYPYEGEAQDPLEEAERQVFDVLAVNVSDYLKSFNEADTASKRFTFKLLKQALADNPASVQKILSDVLQLPVEKQNEFAKLLEATSLTSIISAAKVITDRLNFLRALEALLNDDETKDVFLERDQLHKIIADETWIFGEEFHLTSNEETLNEVLEKHLEKLGHRSDDNSPVLREGDKQGRIDLMLGRTIPQSRSEYHENLVIELKRSSKDIDTTVLNQVQSYAIAVAEDPRFKHTKTKWYFWAVSVKMNDAAIRSVNQGGRLSGQYYLDGELNIEVWAKTWGQIIRDCRSRLEFYREKLNYEATRDSAKAYLKKYHDKYLPPVGIGAPDEEPETPVDDAAPLDATLESEGEPQTARAIDVGGAASNGAEDVAPQQTDLLKPSVEDRAANDKPAPVRQKRARRPKFD